MFIWEVRPSGRDPVQGPRHPIGHSWITGSVPTDYWNCSSDPVRRFEIENAQNVLKELNLYNGEIDGINGNGTKSAIKEFQKLAGLTVDGVIGPITKSALDKGEDAYVSIDTNEISINTNESTSSTNNGQLTVDLINYDPNKPCTVGYVNDSQIWVPDPCFYPVFVFRYGQTAQVNSQAELDAYLSQNWSLTKEKTYNSLGKVPTQNYTSCLLYTSPSPRD